MPGRWSSRWGADARRTEIEGRKSAGGDALSALGRKSARKAIKGRSHLPQSQESGLGAEKRFDGTGRADTMLVNETELARDGRATYVIWEMSA
jgi:hypothetical protein